MNLSNTWAIQLFNSQFLMIPVNSLTISLKIFFDLLSNSNKILSILKSYLDNSNRFIKSLKIKSISD